MTASVVVEGFDRVDQGPFPLVGNGRRLFHIYPKSSGETRYLLDLGLFYECLFLTLMNLIPFFFFCFSLVFFESLDQPLMEVYPFGI